MDEVADYKKYLSLAKAQRSIGKVLKTKSNGFTKSKYAGLDDIINAISEADGEFAVFDNVVLNNKDEMLLQTSFVCEHGIVSVSSPMPYQTAVKSGNEIHKIGSAITYLRRYNRQNLFNIAAEDDDGNSMKGVQIDLKKKSTEELGEYKMKGGQYEGKRIMDVDPLELGNYINQFKQQAQKSKAKLPPQFKELVDVFNQYMDQ